MWLLLGIEYGRCQRTDFVTIKATANGGDSAETVIEVVYSERPQSLILVAEFTEDVTGLSFDFTFSAGTFENQALALPSVSFGTITVQLSEAPEMFSIIGLMLVADGNSVYDEYITLHPDNDRMEQSYEVGIELLNSDSSVDTVAQATISLIVEAKIIEAVEEVAPSISNEESINQEIAEEINTVDD